jgi:FkbM family methyltransferase
MTKVTYSQFGEDITAQHLLSEVESGFYVDIGAHHPIKHSNTAALHLLGWHGLNVEPMRQGHRLFQRFRPHAINVRAAIHNELDEVTLYKFRGGLTNTVLEDRAVNLRKNKEAVGEEVVPALDLNQVFERHVPDGVHVNYLSVDIEGYDTQALLAFDLTTHRPDVICVEIHELDMLAMGTHPVVRFLGEHGYYPYSVNVMSFTFVNLDAVERLGQRRALRLQDRWRQHLDRG